MTQLDEIISGLYRISTFNDPPGITFNQYLIKDEKNILIHTGSVLLFPQVVEKVRQVVDISALNYVFISHFAGDECGALSFLLALNRDIVPVSSAATAGHLADFGIHSKPTALKEGDELVLGRKRLQFVTYPSEAHLRDGLVAYEVTDKVLFSSDLFIRSGKEPAPVVKGDRSVLKEIPALSSPGFPGIPDEERRRKCQEAIGKLDIALIAVGHGPVIDLRP